MKFLEKIALVIYSNIILILSIVLCLLIFGWLDMNLIGNIIYKVIVGDVSMKKFGLGIAILLFAIIISLCSSGMGLLVIGIGIVGLIFSIIGFIENK